MAFQLSVAVRNAQADAWESTAGTSVQFRFYSGAQPANCAAAASGTLLATITCPSDWMSAASAGAKTLSGSWTTTGAAAGSAGHFRVYDSAGTNCHGQGSVTATGGGGDVTLDNVVIAVAQVVTMTAFTYTQGNA